VLSIESEGDGAASPTPEGRRYSLPFLLSPATSSSVSPFTLSFELLNFDPDDTFYGDLLLDSAEVMYHVLDDSKIPWRAEKAYSAEGFTFEEWAPHGAPPFTSPEFFYTGEALAVRGDTDRADVFGYWSSPGDDVIIEPGRLYRATFRVDSDVAASDRARVPQFRLRMNETGLQASTFVAVESRGGGEDSPVAGEPRDYTVYFLPPEAIAGHGLIFSFDFLNFDATDDAGATLRLYSVRVESVEAALVLTR